MNSVTQRRTRKYSLSHRFQSILYTCWFVRVRYTLSERYTLDHRFPSILYTRQSWDPNLVLSGTGDTPYFSPWSQGLCQYHLQIAEIIPYNDWKLLLSQVPSQDTAISQTSWLWTPLFALTSFAAFFISLSATSRETRAIALVWVLKDFLATCPGIFMTTHNFTKASFSNHSHSLA